MMPSPEMRWQAAAPAMRRAQHDAKPLTIAVINNMPDSALRATERQFCGLIDAASHGMLVRLKFYAPPTVERSPAARAHIAEYYDDFENLVREAPDGLIVTGSEVRSGRLADEPFYATIAELAEWAVDAAIPGIWSCLASHAAVRHLDGIERRGLKQKLSGVYECRFNRRSSQILHGLPATWLVPHSRYNGLPEVELKAHGYWILSRSSEAGVDLFCRKQGALQLFFQGHPEYEAESLLREFRRDMARFLEGVAENPPPIPGRCLPNASEARLSRLVAAARQSPDPGLLPEFDAALQSAEPLNLWSGVAQSIYANWLSYLGSRHAACRGHQYPPGLAANDYADIESAVPA